MRFGLNDYFLKYMLKWETKHSETLLNVEKLVSPFSYQLNIHIDGQTRTRTADVPETFNYLLGLNVRTRRVYDDGGRRYLVYKGETRENPSQIVAVIWRDTSGWSKADFERDKQFVAENKLAEGADLIYVKRRFLHSQRQSAGTPVQIPHVRRSTIMNARIRIPKDVVAKFCQRQQIVA